MPTCKGITIELHSQFDVETFPEYHPRSQSYYERRGVDAKAPLFLDEENSTCSVYIPVFPSSQFWISYDVSESVPDDQYCFFKLFINGAHIVSWSCGKTDDWKGKTMFGLYEREEGADGKKRIEKRALCFTTPDREDGQWKDVMDAFDEDANMEIRVYRAKGRKRIAREFEEYAETPHAKQTRGIDLVNAGRAGGGHPKRNYKVALLDPLDRPHISFRYYYRTWAQLEYLGMFDEENGSVSASSGVTAPEDGDLRGGDLLDDGCEDVFRLVSDDDGAELQEEVKGSPSRHRKYRLSIPPSLKLAPPESSRPLPSIPQKHNPLDSSEYTPHPAYPIDKWVARTPSPVKSIREGISTPPPGRKRAITAASLMNVVASAWKRRGRASSEISNDGEARSDSRAQDES